MNKVHTARRFLLGVLSKVDKFPFFDQTPPTGLRSCHLGVAPINWLMQGNRSTWVMRIYWKVMIVILSTNASAWTLLLLRLCLLLQWDAFLVWFVSTRSGNSWWIWKMGTLMLLLWRHAPSACQRKSALCTVPKTCGFNAPNVDDFVPPEILLWIEDLERQCGYPQA